jgi:dihydrofolate synthase/folylpolyglutamate synthase
MRDKDAGGMLRRLAPAIGRLVVTQPATPRARPASDLAAEAIPFVQGVPVDAVPDPGAALAAALAHGPDIVVAGSIFLVGEALALLAPRAAAPVW